MPDIDAVAGSSQRVVSISGHVRSGVGMCRHIRALRALQLAGSLRLARALFSFFVAFDTDEQGVAGRNQTITISV